MRTINILYIYTKAKENYKLRNFGGKITDAIEAFMGVSDMNETN